MGLRLASVFALWLALSCANEIKKGRTQNHGHYVCSTWGNNHFKTFDGDFYQFPGLCDYNFASDCRESYQEFSIHVQRAVNENQHPDIQYVLITIKDVVIYLTQNAVVVDEQIVTTPYYSSGLLIERSEIYTKVYARAGLVLMWNREDSLMLELDAKFNNHTCGLCGDYNGQQLYNEFISNDMIFNPITFGNMQKINKPNTVCEDPDETQTVTTCNQHRDECLSLLTSSVFADCVSRLNLEMYVQACMQDKCACQGAEDSFCLCSTISEYSRQCSHAGGRPGNWRTEKFCPKTCPGNMIYQESSSPCISTCSHLEISSLCEEHFMDGCFCPEGTVYDDISGKGCVSVNQCHCKQHGSLYSPGQNITNECEECTCDSGRWVCKHLSCPGSCLVEGGAHITTFDGKKYTFHGDCYYVLSKGGINDTHALLAELSPCGSTDKQTCLKTVVLLIDHKKNILVFRSDGTVLLNELEVHLPHVTASFSVFQPTSYHLIVHTYFGLKLQIQLVPIMQLFVIVDQSAQGKLQGLCGNFNGIECDDFKTAGGLVEATGSAFANTWKAQATCRDQVDNLEDPCALSFESENYAEYWCSLLKNSESPFARCHSVIDPVEYYKRCKYDTCNCKNSEECLCGALSSYARACAFKGIMLGGWRQSVCNKEVSSCPASQVFLYNLTTCQHTCRSLADGEKYCLEGFIPIDGCGCPDNTYMNEKGNCVPISYCTCYYKGSYLEPGDVIVKQEERCVCRNGILHCTQVTHMVSFFTACQSPKIHFDCSSVKSWSSQTPLQLSCHTLGTDYFQTECVSGCMCPHGLIDDGRGGCVREKDCPCIHNKQFYSSGEDVKVGCNKCTCQKGKWTCTNNVCFGTCTIYGSGHYISFDGKHYDFDGHCEYVAAQDYCGEDLDGSFSIVTVNVPCGTTGVTCSKAIKIFLGRTELKLEGKKYEAIQRDVGHDIQYWTRTVGLYLVIEASNGVMLIWDKKTTIFISLVPYYKGKVCGLCGNFDDTSNNDFTTRSGLQVTNPLEFGNSWKLSGSCPDVVDEILPCNLKPHRKSWAEKECSIIRSEVFKDCHAKVDPAPFYENCVHDACSCDSGGDCECFCSAVAAYAHECNKTGVCVFWRTPDICPIFCDYYNHYNECKWHYEPCGRQIKTCRIINNVSTNFSLPYLEGCYPRCSTDEPIFDEDSNKCVTEDKCGCYIANGTRYEPGEEVPTDKVCLKCICYSTGNIVCMPDPACTTIPTTTTPPTTTLSTTTTITTTTPTTTTTTTVPTSTTTTSPVIGESYWPCNCTKAICVNNKTWELVTTVCELPPKPSCINGLAPVLVQGECCWHWECDCYCTGWGDPHYVTFDGHYYSYQGNCTYVLVEEINKNIDNFGIYIDNYHCIAQDRVSCPRTLIVRHETQEVHIKTITLFPLKVQVTVNNQEVATPYKKYGVRIFKSGINYVVEISRLGVNVTYNGWTFSIRLPYQRFGNNTQGQCGTCTNNTADDCMLPGGKIIGNCETMADHWVINDPEKPHCSPSLTTTEAPPITPPSCKPSDLCKLIKEGPFKACHPFVNPDHYYAACVFDSCALPNSKLECASLQTYAALCADQGVCVDWRGHTRDICPLKCPSHKVYKACGPIEEVTCKSSQVAQNQTGHVEGCFCPAGTMPYGEGVDVCVKTCGCVGPDNKPRKFGEVFEFDCKKCICLEGGSGIICEPLKCPAQADKPSCSDEGFYEVTEVSPDNICCSITSCRCNASFCTTIPPKCKIGYELVSNIATGKCCPTYECVPKKVCVVGNAEYMPGSPVVADKCQNCVCTDKSNSSGLNVVTCKRIPCNERCQPGYELKDVKGECCPKCVQTKCVVNKGDSTVLILSPGEMENDPKDNCTVYSCVSIKGQLISSTSEITCPSFNEENCKAGTITLLPNGCCKTCIPRDSPSPCSVTQIVDHITHKGCRSVDKVYLTQCEGSCGTFSLYSAEANSMEHKCSCCREAATSEKQVLLECPNGKSLIHKYLHVDRCECLDSECTQPSSSEKSKESEEQSAIERVKRAIQKILK
ncbi:mucin-2 [Terrapene carolina triunguis]|nr:mucin-2 [Terrapene carolina triunguis]